MDFDLATLFPAVPPDVRDSRQLIYLARHGSHAYGTNTPTSDLDLRGIVSRPIKELLGFKSDFQQMEARVPHDTVAFSIKRTIDLAAKANPNVLEILFVEDSDVLTMTAAGETLLASRDLFLTKKIQHTFAGYAKSQIARIETHRRWLINPPKEKPDRKAYGLPERTVLPADQLSAAVSMMTKKVESWEVDFEALDPASRLHMIERVGTALAEMNMSLDNRYKSAGKLLGFSDNFLQILDLERKYKSAMDEWTHFQQWKTERNPERAALEEKFGFDTKHGMHLMRLALSCVDTLRTGKLKVKQRPDLVEYLLSIRYGALVYDALFEKVNAIMAQIPDAVRESPLPDAPDFDALEDLCVTVTSMSGDGGFAVSSAIVDPVTTAVVAPRREFKPSRMSDLVIEAIEAENTRAIDIIEYVMGIQPSYRASSVRNALTSMKKAGVLGVTGESCRYAYFVALMPEGSNADTYRLASSLEGIASSGEAAAAEAEALEE